MNPFSQKDWARSAHKASEGQGSILWTIAGAILIIVFLITLGEYLLAP